MLPSFSLLSASFFVCLTVGQPGLSSHRYDYVIVGGGTCGLVLANRLSEDPSTTVAVIEAGGSVFDNPNVTITTGFGHGYFTPIDYAYNSTPQIYTDNRTQIYHSGKALGGTSTINGECLLFLSLVLMDYRRDVHPCRDSPDRRMGADWKRGLELVFPLAIL